MHNLETDKFAMGKHGLRYTLPSKADYIKCIMASNHFCTLSTPQYQADSHIMCIGIGEAWWHWSVL